MYSKRSGKDLRDGLTSRFASAMIIVTLLINVEIGILFSPSELGNEIRRTMRENDGSLGTTVGIMVIVSVFCSILGILATFLAWTSMSAVSDENVHLVLRSTLGRYVAQLPKTMLLLSIYTFLGWLIMVLFLLLPKNWAWPILSIFLVAFICTTTLASAFERMVMESGAMGEKRILDKKDVDISPPAELDGVITTKIQESRENKLSARKYYAAMYEGENVEHTADVEIGSA